jgi:OPA family sugar phosphate sensor protein UhpC-like MFS transporter
VSEVQPDLLQTDDLSPRHKTWRVNIFAITWLTYAGYYFCRKPFSQAKAPLAYRMELTDTEIAHIGTGFLVAYMLGQFITAYLAKRFPAQRLLLVGMAISLCASLAMGMVVGGGPAAYTPFMALMILNGLAQGTGWGACIGIMAHWFTRQERGTVLAFWATCYMLGSVVAKFLASFMLSLDVETITTIGANGEALSVDVSTTDALAWMFWTASGFFAVIWLLVLFFVRDKPESYGLSAIVAEESQVGTPEEDVPKEVWSWDVKRTVWMMGIAYFCFKFVRYALDSWAPKLIEETFQNATDIAGYQAAMFDLAGFAGVVFAGVASDKFFSSSRTKLTFFMTLGMCAAVFFMARMGPSSSTLFVIGLAFTGFMLAGPDSLLSGVGSIDVASKQGAVVAAAIINGIGSLGAVFQEQIIGRMLDASDTQTDAISNVLLVLVIASLAGAAACYVLVLWKRDGRSTL